MSKINQIQIALKEIEGGKFQKLADAYLLKKGYENVNTIGSVDGSDKVRKGTPDSYFRQSNGKLIFCEYTTDQTGLFKKLESDINKCLDVDKTGVSLDEIEEIVFCYNSNLSASHQQNLVNLGKNKGIKVQHYGIGAISYDLYQNYPNLAQDFLSVSIDTGQILELSDFISEIGKNKLTTPLNTEFHYREDDLSEILESLGHSNLVIVSGSAGVGKSRIALEAMEHFKESDNTVDLRVVHNKGLDLYEDIRSYFSEPGEFLILVDDANRLSQFNHFINLIQNQRQDQVIKIIATVRDYAKDKVCQLAKPLGVVPKVELKPMSTKEIKSLIKKQFGINNSIYLDRIAKISGGNPRLAIMAAMVAKEENNIESINNVSSLYDQYFSSISSDLTKLQNNSYLKVAGIISFFRVIDKSNEKLIGLIYSTFGINSDELWESVEYLHNMEAVDIYENEIVKISDQVFATYLFHLCFFKKKLFDFSVLLDAFFPTFNNRMKDSLYPCISSFGFRSISDEIKPTVIKKWELFTQNNDSNIFEFIKTFWFLLTSNVLIYIRNSILQLNEQIIDIDSIELENRNASLQEHPILELLSLFQNSSDESTFKIVLELTIKYLEKVPNSSSHVINLFCKDFGIDLHSHRFGYSRQISLIQTLWNKTEQGNNLLLSKIFIAVISNYLPEEYEYNESSKNSITIHRIKLLDIEPLKKLRSLIWEGLTILYVTHNLQKQVLDTFNRYCEIGYRFENVNILKSDSIHVLSFFNSKLNPTEFYECLIVQKYQKMLLRFGITSANEIAKTFDSKIFNLYKLLSLDYSDVSDAHKFDEERNKRIQQYIDTQDTNDFQLILDQTEEILVALDNDSRRDMHHINNAIPQLFVSLGEKDHSLLLQILDKYLHDGNLLSIKTPYSLISRLIAESTMQTFQILNKYEYLFKDCWLFMFYSSIPKEDITQEFSNNIYELYEKAEPTDYIHGFDYLLKYTETDPEIIIKIIKLIVEKSKVDVRYIRSLDLLFNPYSEINKTIFEVFDDNFQFLKETYLIYYQNSNHADFNGATLSRILSIEPAFILEITDLIFANDDWSYRYSDDIDYSFLWNHEFCYEVINSVVIDLKRRSIEEDEILITGNYLQRLFCQRAGNNHCSSKIKNEQDKYIESYLAENAQDIELIRVLFPVISNFELERKVKLIGVFLANNQSLDDFKSLQLEPTTGAWTGSAVNYYQTRKDFWESLLPLCNTVELLDHKQLIEMRLQGWRETIENEKRSEFMDDD